MMRLQGWLSRLAVSLLCTSMVCGASAGDLQIQSFDGTGRLTFNTLVCATNYRLEWASSPAGPWTNFTGAAGASLDNIPATPAGSVTCFVPMCYRVVAMVTNLWPTIDLAGDLAFGDVLVGQTATRTLTILNRGSADLTVTGIDYPEGFNGPWTGIVPAGWSQNVNVTFSPASDRGYDGTTTVHSDSAGGTNTLVASGMGVLSTYMLVDLAEGPSASSYPVSYVSSIPPGGWTATYKTTKLVLRYIPGGTFTMGSPTAEVGRNTGETLHTVTLTQPIYIGVFEITQRQWELVMGTNPSYFNNSAYYASRPVEQISYNAIRGSVDGANWPSANNVDATSFIGTLRSKTALTTLDLPTESQWEYACRAGTTTALNNGQNLTNAEQSPYMTLVGRYSYNAVSAYNQSSTPTAGTATVGSYLPNQWGLYDMHGNVWEWCLDWKGTYPGDAEDPKGSTTGSSRVERGGGWGESAGLCRSAVRNGGPPATASITKGFRLARTLP